MKYRTLKKYARARHSYGHSQDAIRVEISELAHLKSGYLKKNLRFWTSHWNEKRKFLRKHPDYKENGFGMVVKVS